MTDEVYVTRCAHTQTRDRFDPRAEAVDVAAIKQRLAVKQQLLMEKLAAGGQHVLHIFHTHHHTGKSAAFTRLFLCPSPPV